MGIEDSEVRRVVGCRQPASRRAPVALAGLAAALACLAALAPAASAGSAAFTAAADAYVRSDAPRANFGASPRISAQGGTDSARKAYLRFDVAVPLGSDVESATLLLFSRSAGSSEGVALHGLWNARWDEETITYLNAPQEDPEEVSRAAEYLANAWLSFDVTPLVPGSGSVSMVLTAEDETWHGFRSSENKTPPVLVLETRPAPEPPAPSRRARGRHRSTLFAEPHARLIADPVIAAAVGVACPPRPRLLAQLASGGAGSGA
jgi:hypothetical protein